MRYKLIDKYKILQVTNVIDNTKGLITNASDIEIDSHNAGKLLDETITPPTYNPDTQELKTVYIDDGTKIIRDFEVLDIVPSEQDKLKDQIISLNTMIDDTTSLVLDLYVIVKNTRDFSRGMN